MRCLNRELYFLMFRELFPDFRGCLLGSTFPLSGYTTPGVRLSIFRWDSIRISLAFYAIRYTS